MGQSRGRNTAMVCAAKQNSQARVFFFYFYTFTSRLWLSLVTKKHIKNDEAAERAGSERTLCSTTTQNAEVHHELRLQMISEPESQNKADS